MIDYKIVARKNPGKKDEPAKYYAAPASRELIETDKLCEIVSRNTTINKGEMKNVLDNLMESIPDLLLNGCSIRLGNLGTLRVTFGSQGAEVEKDFKAYMIKEPRVIFTASDKLREKIRNEARFNRLGAGGSEESGDEEEGDDSEL